MLPSETDPLTGILQQLFNPTHGYEPDPAALASRGSNPAPVVAAVLAHMGAQSGPNEVLRGHPLGAPVPGKQFAWAGHNFGAQNAGEFLNWLASRGVHYGHWAQAHPAAAALLGIQGGMGHA
jgi:hypothetical protein